MDNQQFPYLHSTDTRTPLEKLLSNHIAKAMSELNIKRVRSIPSIDIAAYDHFHFICLSGLPPVQGEFDVFGLAEKTVITFEGYFGDHSTEEYIQIFKRTSMQR